MLIQMHPLEKTAIDLNRGIVRLENHKKAFAFQPEEESVIEEVKARLEHAYAAIPDSFKKK